jgi:hypothetical protein
MRVAAAAALAAILTNDIRDALVFRARFLHYSVAVEERGIRTDSMINEALR